MIKNLNELIKNTDLSEVDEETRKSIEQLNFDIVKEHLKFLLRFSFRDDLIDKSLIKLEANRKSVKSNVQQPLIWSSF